MAGITYLHTGGVLSRKSGGGTSPLLYTILSDFRTSFSFFIMVGGWDHFTGALRHFKDIQNVWLLFVHIIHCMDFRWWGEGGEWRLQPVRRADVSTGWWNPPSVLRPGCCCYMQEIAPVDYWHQAHSSSLGGPRHFGTGPGLTVFSLWHCLGHSQGSLQCHFSRL